jgi:hypothetical protein
MKPLPTKAAPSLRKLANACLVLGSVLALPALVGLAHDPIQFERSYLVAFLYVLAIPAGSLALLLLYRLTAGRWGEELNDVLSASARTLPYVSLLFLPLLAGFGKAFPVLNLATEGSDLTAHEALYFRPSFFVARALLYFIAWNWLALSISRRHPSSSRQPPGSAGFAGLGLIVYFLTMTAAAVDWGMSLRGNWCSSVYGLLLIVGQTLSALPLAILVRILIARRPSPNELMPSVAVDLGTLLFAAVMIWAYLGFSQLLIIWSANLPEEVTWYTSRLGPGWRTLAALLVVFHFLLPFFLLLMRKVKRRGPYLAAVCAILFAARLPEMLWLIVPSYHPEHFRLHWMDFLLPISVLLLWAWPFLRELDRLHSSPSDSAIQPAGLPAQLR